MRIIENAGKSRDVQRFKEDKKLKSPGFFVIKKIGFEVIFLEWGYV